MLRFEVAVEVLQRLLECTVPLVFLCTQCDNYIMFCYCFVSSGGVQGAGETISLPVAQQLQSQSTQQQVQQQQQQLQPNQQTHVRYPSTRSHSPSDCFRCS